MDTLCNKGQTFLGRDFDSSVDVALKRGFFNIGLSPGEYFLFLFALQYSYLLRNTFYFAYKYKIKSSK